jgi:hypothetical protein
VVYREFFMPFVPVVGMTLMEGMGWESGEIKSLHAVLEDGAWTVVCQPEEDRRRQHGHHGLAEAQSVEDIVSDYEEEGWEALAPRTPKRADV